ncbi:Rieske (2Fe-2S) protein [Paenibacillus abyssi]|uniref:(2Fe-2S)-binding protein n=1 Tax=Paenibacillus abyssi TaxID=1340531 RepID=A0A917FRQ3_9BACL|nr:Rieske (2Fe-2S) protein [Paenibacillus abyssi]GGG02041.1 (2Fe-2S)-binding protein [Paenibacillus abyssi]
MKEYFVAKETEVSEGGVVTVQAGKRVITVFKINDEFYAMNNTCPHKGASLCEGKIDKERKIVRCPWHLWDWSVETGELEAYTKKRLPVYTVKVIDGDILLYTK